MKLLVISMAGNGDALFATPLIHELRLGFPDAQIDALVRWPGARDLLDGNPHINQLFQKDLPSVGKGEALRFLWSLRNLNYEVTVNTFPQSRLHYALVARFIGAPVRIGHDYSNFNWIMRRLMNRLKKPDYSSHCVENNLALLDFLGLRPKLERHEYEIHLTLAEDTWASEFVTSRKLDGATFMGMHVGSGSTKNLALRRWPLPNYQALIVELLKTYPNLTVLLFGGSDEKEDLQRLLEVTNRKRVLAPETKNFRQAVALLKRCRVFLSVDTALMHLAAVAAVPGQIVIETPTWNKTVEPYGRPFHLVPNPAVGGRNLDFYRYDGRGIQGTASDIVECMRSVTVESVAAAVREKFAQVGN